MIARVNKLRRTVSLLVATLWLCAGMMPAVVWATDPPPVQLAQASASPAPQPRRLLRRFPSLTPILRQSPALSLTIWPRAIPEARSPAA